MPFSFHSHSGQFCLHAEGTLEEVVQRAIALGFTHLGLSEHMPRLEQRHLYEEESHLTPGDLMVMFDAYVTEGRRLQHEYRHQINILVGMETEFIDRSYVALIKELVARHKIDYLVGSLHHACDMPIDVSKESFDDVVKTKGYNDIVLDYFDRQYELLTMIKPTIIGHFDVVFKYLQSPRLDDVAKEKMIRNIDYAIGYGALFEINSAAIGCGKVHPYPTKDVLMEILQRGGKVTISDDAHGPLAVGQYYDKLHGYLREMNINTITILEYSHERNDVTQRDINDILSSSVWKLLQ